MNHAFLLSLNPEANAADQWDYGYLKDFLEGNLWQTPDWQGFNIIETDFIPMLDRAIVVLPARHHAGRESEVNDELWQLQKVVLFLLGDEEAEFDIKKITHKFCDIWVQNPRPGKHDKYNKLGTGYPPQSKMLKDMYQPKDLTISFSGQITHQRRRDMWEHLLNMSIGRTDIALERTKGFTQGKTHTEYYDQLARTKIAPAPSGAEIPDSFRLFEALEAMAMPIADNRNSQRSIVNYWEWFLGYPPPFVTINEWQDVGGYTGDILADWPNNVHKLTAWWVKYKRDFAYKVMGQLNGL